MPLLLDQVNESVQLIDRCLEPSSKRYGRLLNWQNPPDPFWHYGIGLSDTYIFDTGRGLKPFKRDDAKIVIGIDAIAFSPAVTIQRLKHSLCVFAGWKYTLLGWNCEHLSRLIATDRPRCYQSQSIWWLCNLTPKGDHKTAHKVLENYLRQVDSSLIC